jgi:hypothetical protein
VTAKDSSANDDFWVILCRPCLQQAAALAAGFENFFSISSF